MKGMGDYVVSRITRNSTPTDITTGNLKLLMVLMVGSCRRFSAEIHSLLNRMKIFWEIGSI